MLPDDPKIRSDDLRMMEALGISLPILNELKGEADLPETDYEDLTDKPAPADLSPSELEILRSGGATGSGANLAANRDSEYRMTLSLLRECREMINQSYDLDFVAKFLQISPEAVIEQATNAPPDLCAFRLKDEGPWLFPRWQFSSSGCIPSLARVLSEARVSLSPLFLSRVMLMKSADLENDSEDLSPRDWLVRGLDPDTVIILLRDL